MSKSFRYIEAMHSWKISNWFCEIIHCCVCNCYASNGIPRNLNKKMNRKLKDVSNWKSIALASLELIAVFNAWVFVSAYLCVYLVCTFPLSVQVAFNLKKPSKWKQWIASKYTFICTMYSKMWLNTTSHVHWLWMYTLEIESVRHRCG